MRFHLVSLPHTNTTDDFSACAFTEKVRKFAIMMMDRGHEVFLYAGEYNQAPCTEHIPIVQEKERAKHVGSQHYIFASFDYSLPIWRKFNQRCAEEIRVRAQPTDFVCVIGGRANEELAQLLPDMRVVEFGCGYGGTFAPFRVWESYAWMHTCYGAATGGNPNAADGLWFDAVIPGYFEVERFPFKEVKEDYYFFIGRLTYRKGFNIAIEVCRELGKKLIIAGQPDPGAPPPSGVGIEYVGVIGPEERGKIMSGAIATFVPTIYVEPFGNVAVESQGCGTPVLCTDWGAFTETVVHGVTGYRCRTFGEFLRAAKMCESGVLNPYTIRAHAQQNYSLKTIGEQYERYFERLMYLFNTSAVDGGWYEGRTHL